MPAISELIAQADQALLRGEFKQAEILVQTVLKSEPSNVTALTLLGLARAKQNQFEQALEAFELSESYQPNIFENALWRSRCNRKLCKPVDALAAARRAVELQPTNASGLHQLGICLLDLKLFEEAAVRFAEALSQDPTGQPLLVGLSLAVQGLGRNTEAINVLRKVHELNPNSVQILELLYHAVENESDPLAALDCALKLVTLDPKSANSHLRLARSLAANARRAEAEEQLSESRRLGEGDPVIAFGLGSAWQILGRIDLAKTEYERSIQLNPVQGASYAGLAYIRRTDASDTPLIERMNRLTSESKLDPEQRSFLHYALGKSYEDLRQYDFASFNFGLAHEIVLGSLAGGNRFDRDFYKIQIEELIGSPVDEPIGCESKTAIFIFGMPRSGTTLVEQILSRHPEIGAAGELGFWLSHRAHRKAPPEEIEKLAQRYLAMLGQLQPGLTRVCDKMPDNYLELGMLYRAFPNAKFIHCKRNPLDTCVSLYTTVNRLGISWSHRLEDIGFVYEQYLRVMDHWRSTLPPNVIYEISYEDLVQNPSETIYGVLDYCAVRWDERCLQPDANSKGVFTPSAWQVRQPLYQSSIGRWQNYPAWTAKLGSLNHS